MKAMTKIGAVLLLFFVLLALLLYRLIGSTQNEVPFEPGDYYVEVDGVNIHASVNGAGDETIVLLSAFGTANPIDDFAPLTSKLSDSYRVVTIEYPGYGLSDETDKPRTNQNIVYEIRKTLKGLNIKPPYILMPHSLSGIYSLYYAVTYPKEIQAIIGIDNSVPNQAKEQYQAIFSNNVQRSKKKPELSKVKYSGTRCSGKQSIVNEYDMIYENAKQLFDTPFPKNLPVHMFLSSENTNRFSIWKTIHEEMISNPDIQTIEILKGGHNLHWSQSETLAKNTKEFLEETVGKH